MEFECANLFICVEEPFEIRINTYDILVGYWIIHSVNASLVVLSGGVSDST